MKRIAIYTVLLALWGYGSRANAELGAIDEVPAATLLVPYFEVDLDDANGTDTLFTINNASATAVLVHVTLWTDWAVPSLGFDVYLTGYDNHTIDLRDLFVKGKLPNTASAGQDPTDTISNHGTVSQDINFASCSGRLPPLMLTTGRDHIRAAHTGLPSPFNGQCSGQAFGDNIARGYITADTVNQCTGGFTYPTTPGYLQTIVTYQNVLWGNYVILDRTRQTAVGSPVVHIESSNPSTPDFVPGDYTFYGRYVGFAASDQREPLATNWAARYLRGAPFAAGSDVIIWRDTKVPPSGPNVGRCGVPPSWYPLGYEYIEAFDEEENVVGDVPDGFGGLTKPDRTSVAPAATNRASINSPEFFVLFDFGWLFLNMNATVAGDFFPGVSQSFVTVLHRSAASDVGLNAVPMDNANEPLHQNPPTQFSRRGNVE